MPDCCLRQKIVYLVSVCKTLSIMHFISRCDIPVRINQSFICGLNGFNLNSFFEPVPDCMLEDCRAYMYNAFYKYACT